MNYRIYLSPPDVGPLEEEYVLDALRSGWVAPLGPHVEALEAEVAEYVGVKHAVALSSGTAGLHLALLALGVRPGDEVVVPTMTFAATAFAVRYVGARPVFIDSEPTSYNLDPDALAELLEQRARAGRLPAAVATVDIYGQTADYARIEPICAQYGVPILEDAAEALGATNGDRMAGSFGRAGVFSFNGNKIMTTSGGGMLVTDDAALGARVRHLATQAREPVSWYEHRDVGYNYRLSNILAALGRAQLQRLPAIIERRRSIYDRYRAQLAGTPGVRLVEEAPWGRGNAWLTLVAFADECAPEANRAALAAQGVESRPTWKPMHMQPIFKDDNLIMNSVAEGLFVRGLCLPSGYAMSDADIDEVAACIANITREIGAI